MKIIAHRGVTNQAPENTMAAFLDAVKQQYAIECDVRITRDGVPVIFHDKDLKRMIGSNQLVKDLSSSQLQAVLIDDQHPVPTLESVIKHILPHTFVDFDIKVDEAVPPTLELLKGALAEYGLLLSARTDTAASLLKQNFSEVAFLHPQALVAARHARKHRLKTMVCRSWRINRPVIKRAAASGLDVYVYGGSSSLDWLKRQGVAGLIKDV